MATDSIARRRLRFALALREGPFLWSRMLLPTCVWDVVFRHGTCVPDMSARILSRFSLGIVNNKANGKVQIYLRGTTQGTTHSNASAEVRWQGQHTTQVFSIPFDSCNMNRLLASNELDLVGGSDIGIGRHAEIHEPFFVPTKGGRNWMQVGGIENDASRTSGQDTELQAVRWKRNMWHMFRGMKGKRTHGSKLSTEERVEL